MTNDKISLEDIEQGKREQEISDANDGHQRRKLPWEILQESHAVIEESVRKSFRGL